MVTFKKYFDYFSDSDLVRCHFRQTGCQLIWLLLLLQDRIRHVVPIKCQQLLKGHLTTLWKGDRNNPFLPLMFISINTNLIQSINAQQKYSSTHCMGLGCHLYRLPPQGHQAPVLLLDERGCPGKGLQRPRIALVENVYTTVPLVLGAHLHR